MVPPRRRSMMPRGSLTHCSVRGTAGRSIRKRPCGIHAFRAFSQYLPAELHALHPVCATAPNSESVHLSHLHRASAGQTHRLISMVQADRARVTFDSLGNRYGTTANGGASGLGTVWKYTSSGGLTQRRAWPPRSSLKRPYLHKARRNIKAQCNAKNP